MIEKLKAVSKDASKFKHMEEKIEALERELDELKAKQKVEEEMMKQKYQAEN